MASFEELLKQVKEEETGIASQELPDQNLSSKKLFDKVAGETTQPQGKVVNLPYIPAPEAGITVKPGDIKDPALQTGWLEEPSGPSENELLMQKNRETQAQLKQMRAMGASPEQIQTVMREGMEGIEEESTPANLAVGATLTALPALRGLKMASPVIDAFGNVTGGLTDIPMLATKGLIKSGAKKLTGKAVTEMSENIIPPITAKNIPEMTADLTQALNEIPIGTKATKGGFKNVVYWMEQLPETVQDRIYNQTTKIDAIINQEMSINRKLINKFRYSLPRKSAERIETFSIAQQRGGKDVLESMGKEIPELTEKELAFYDWRRGQYEEAYNRLNEARIALGKDPLGYVENYSTFFRHLEEQTNKGINPYIADKGILLSNYDPYFTKKRLGGKIELELDAFDNFEKYQRSATRYINTAPVVKVFRDALEKSTLKDTNPKIYNDLLRYTRELTGEKYGDFVKSIREAISPITKYVPQVFKETSLSSKVATASILGKGSTIISQLLNIPFTAAECGPINTAKAITRVLGSDKVRKNIMENFDMWWARRYEDISGGKGAVPIKEFLQHPLQKTQTGLSALTRHPIETPKEIAMFPIDLMDNISAKITAEAARLQGVQNGLKGQALKNYVNHTLVKLQGSATAANKTTFQKRDWGAIVNVLGNFQIAQANYIARGLTHATKFPDGKKRYATSKMTTLLMGMAATNALTDSLGMKSFFPEPIDEYVKTYYAPDKELSKFVGFPVPNKSIPMAATKAAMETVLGFTPILGSIKYGGSLLEGPVLGTATKAAKSVMELKPKWTEILALAGVPKTVTRASRKGIQALQGKTQEETLGEIFMNMRNQKELDERDPWRKATMDYFMGKGIK